RASPSRQHRVTARSRCSSRTQVPVSLWLTVSGSSSVSTVVRPAGPLTRARVSAWQSWPRSPAAGEATFACSTGRGHESKRCSRHRLPFLHLELAVALHDARYGGHMRALRITLIAAAALAVPALLAFGVHLAAGRSFTAPPPLVARVSTTPIATPAPARQPDVSGPCDEAEHRNDPRCAGSTTPTHTTTVDDKSGHHSGTDDSRSGSGKGRGRSSGDD